MTLRSTKKLGIVTEGEGLRGCGGLGAHPAKVRTGAIAEPKTARTAVAALFAAESLLCTIQLQRTENLLYLFPKITSLCPRSILQAK